MQLIAAHKEQRGALMPVLQQARRKFTAICRMEVQKMIARRSGDPAGGSLRRCHLLFPVLSESQGQIQNFRMPGHRLLRQRFRRQCSTSWAECLGIKGGECTQDGKFSLEACRCIGACGLAPVMTINDDVYGRLVADDIDGILAEIRGISRCRNCR